MESDKVKHDYYSETSKIQIKTTNFAKYVLKICEFSCFLLSLSQNLLTMKRIVFIIGIIVVCLSLSAENHSSQNSMFPLVWIRPDSAVVSPSFCDTISATTKYTMMMVCKTLQPDAAQQLWKISRPDSAFYVVSTHGLYTETIPLPSKNKKSPLFLHPCVYMAQHTITSDTTYTNKHRLYIGSDTPTDSTCIVLYEAAYFPASLSRKQSLVFQTYLALKHGITLNKAHYLSVMGDTLWNARVDKRFYHHIKGIGSDSVYDFYSKVSASMEDDIICISSVDTLPHNSYVLLGDDNAELEWYAYENTTAMLKRTWQIKTTNNSQSLMVCFKRDKIGETTDTLYLALLDTEEEIIQTISPDSIDMNNNLCYTIVPSTKQLCFSFISTAETHKSPRKVGKKGNTQYSTGQEENEMLVNDIKITLFPNPTQGEYLLNIRLSKPTYILLRIQDPTGKIVTQQTLTDSSVYQYSGYLYFKGLYLFSFYSNDGRLLSTQELLVY